MSLQERLQTFLADRGQSTNVEILTADASTREYFRVKWDGEKAVACVYPREPADAAHIYVDTTQLFRESGLPVARIICADVTDGIVVQEDLGDRILRSELTGPSDARIDEAIKLIVAIQNATATAYATDAHASTLKFDTEKLAWELNYFRKHYFETYKQAPLSDEDNARLMSEFRELASDLEKRASVLCHRDFHAANLMIDQAGGLRIIDHQDARIGSAAYDFVSLLLDRVEAPPDATWLDEKRRFFLETRVAAGLPEIGATEFEEEFDLQTIQRCLKAAGTFSFQSARRGKTHFIPYIQPMFQIAVTAAERLDRFPAISEIIGREIHSSNS